MAPDVKRMADMNAAIAALLDAQAAEDPEAMEAARTRLRELQAS